MQHCSYGTYPSANHQCGWKSFLITSLLFIFIPFSKSFLWWEKGRIVCLSPIKLSHTASYPSSNRFIWKTQMQQEEEWPKAVIFGLFHFWIFKVSAEKMGDIYGKHKLSKALISLTVFHRLLIEKHCPKSLITDLNSSNTFLCKAKKLVQYRTTAHDLGHAAFADRY